MLTSPGFGFSSVNRLRFLLILCHKLLVSCPAWFSRARQNQKRSCPHPRIPPSRTARESGPPIGETHLITGHRSVLPTGLLTSGLATRSTRLRFGLPRMLRKIQALVADVEQPFE